MLVIVVGHRHYSWVRLGCFHPLEASAAPFGTMNASPQGENI